MILFPSRLLSPPGDEARHGEAHRKAGKAGLLLAVEHTANYALVGQSDSLNQATVCFTVCSPDESTQ